MGLDIFYKVRAKKEANGRIHVTEKGILRFLRNPESRYKLRMAALEHVKQSQDKVIYANYIWDPVDQEQIAYSGKEFATDSGWERR